MSFVNSETSQSTLRRWGVTPDQDFKTLCEGNLYVFRLQASNRIHGTRLESRRLIASAYAGKRFSMTRLLRIRKTVAENIDKYKDEAAQHVDMWRSSKQPRGTCFVSATFNLAWVFWEAARRSQMADGECKFTLIVMNSASLRDAGAVLGDEMLFEQAQRLQNFTNVCQEVLVPVVVTSEIIAILPLPTGSCIPSWIVGLSPDGAEHQPSESVSSNAEEGAKDSIPASERSLEDEPKRADINRSESFKKFCDGCASAYAKVIDQDKETQAKALAQALLCDPGKVQPGGRIELSERKFEDIATLAIDICRWPTRLKRWEKWQEWHEKQAAFDWPGKYVRLLSSLKKSLHVNELLDGPTSEESPVVLSPIEITRKRKRPTIEDEDSVANHPDEQQDSKRARSASSEIEDEGEGPI